MVSSLWLLGLCAIPAIAYDPVEFPDGSDLNQFVTRPEIRAPRLNITKHHPDAIKDGYLFFSPYSELQDQPKTIRREHIPCQNGAHIYDGNGDLVWSGACKYNNRNIHAFRPHVVDGKHMLSLFVSSGNVEPGVTEKDAKQSHVLLNNHYEEVSRPAVGGIYAGTNFHEFRMLPGGQNAIITRDFMRKPNSVLHNKTEIPVWSTGFREVVLATGEEIFDWGPDNDGVDIDESFDMTGLNHTTKDAPWDFFHINSVDKSESGDYLVSGRHTFTVYKISGKTGKLMWRLGGRMNDFKMLDGLDFHWQHHARFRHENETHTILSLFDNHADDAARDPNVPNGVSNALYIELDTASTPMTARAIRKFERPDGGKSTKLGSVQQIGDTWDKSSVLVDWAVPVYVSEYDSEDRLVMEARFASARFNSYRGFKFPFKGDPLEEPAFKTLPIAIGNNEQATAMYMSWNGATEVKSWSIHGADDADDEFKELKKLPKNGFETSWVMSGTVRFAYAEALDSDGKSLGRSPTYNATWVETSSMPSLVDDESSSAMSTQCTSSPPVTETLYVTKEAAPAETVYITQTEAMPQATLAPKPDMDVDDSVDDTAALPSNSSSAQKLKELETNEAFGVFCISAFALFGLYIALRRLIYIVARWRHGYRPISNLSREPSYTDAEKAG